jgi:hypothetical protein
VTTEHERRDGGSAVSEAPRSRYVVFNSWALRSLGSPFFVVWRTTLEIEIGAPSYHKSQYRRDLHALGALIASGYLQTLPLRGFRCDGKLLEQCGETNGMYWNSSSSPIHMLLEMFNCSVQDWRE